MLMASFLVFPVVLVALERIEELGKELRDEGVTFSPRASVYLVEASAAIKRVEAERRATHEHLEVATIENGNLRHKMDTALDQMNAVIAADVADARSINAKEIEQLREDVHAVIQIQEIILKKHREVASENESLSTEQNGIITTHQATIAALNEDRTLKYALKPHINVTKVNIDELEASITSLEQDIVTLQEDLVSEREGFAKAKNELLDDLAVMETKINYQTQKLSGSQVHLQRLSKSSRDGDDNLDDLKVQIDQVEARIKRLQEAKSFCVRNLVEERRKPSEFAAQIESLEKQLDELVKSDFEKLTELRRETAAIEEKMADVRAIGIRKQGSLDKVCEVSKACDDEDTEVSTEYTRVWRKAEVSTMRLDDFIGSVVRHQQMINEMENLMEEENAEDIVNKRVLDRDQEELCDKIDEVKQHVDRAQDEKKLCLKLLQENTKKQKEHKKEMTGNIKAMRRTVKELQTEKSDLEKRHSMTIDKMCTCIGNAQAQYEDIECACQEAIQESLINIKSVRETYEETQKQVTEMRESLKRMKAKLEEEESRYAALIQQKREFHLKKLDLEKSMEEIKTATSLLLLPKDNLEKKLEEVLAGHMAQLHRRVAEGKSVEIRIYNDTVRLELVRVENSRLHLSIRQMTQDMNGAKEDGERYRVGTEQSKRDAQVLCASLHESWRDEMLWAQKRHGVDIALVGPINRLRSRLKTRGGLLGHIQTMLHGQMLDFSRRLGDRITVEPQP